MPPKRKSPHNSPTHALQAAVKKGDVDGVSALVAADPPTYLTKMAVMKKCTLAPNAVALLDALGLHNRSPPTVPLHSTVELFSYAICHGADHSTVAYIVHTIRRFMHHAKPSHLWWEGLSVIIQRKSAVLVSCYLESLSNALCTAPDKFITKVIESADKGFALDVIHSPGGQAFLLDMEKTFQPTFVGEVALGLRGRSSWKRPPRFWVITAFKNADMCEVVESIYQLCPLVVGESLYLYGHHNPTTTRTRASWAPAMDRYALFNDKIKDFLVAVHTGNVHAVATQVEQASILVNARDASGVQALTLSSTSPNALALLVCFRQHLHKHDRGTANTPATVYWHVCENGGDSATLTFLMDWLCECASRSSDALWDGMKQALAKQHLPMFTHLLQVGQKTGAMDFNQLTWLVVKSQIDGFPLALLESEPMQEYLGSLDPLGYCEEVTGWVVYGVHRNLPELVECMERWSPQSTRKAMFVFCVDQGLDSPKWREFSRRHELDVRWPRVRDVHLVQHRRLPGLDAIGSHIAKFVEEPFDPCHEYKALTTTRCYRYMPM